MAGCIASPVYEERVCLLCVILIHRYDRTCKESLYSTYPYLTYSNEKSTSPVMKKYSTLGYREKINIKAIAECCGEEQCQEIIPS